MIGQWFRRHLVGQGKHQPAEEPNGPPSPPAPIAASDDASVTAKLRRLVVEDKIASAGCLHMVGLSTLKDRLGERWPMVRGRVHDMADRIIARHLGPLDVHLRLDEETFVVVFAALPKNAAQLVCAKMVEEIVGRLLGDVDTREISVRTLVGEVGDDLAFEDMNLSALIASLAAGALRSQDGSAGSRDETPLPAPDPSGFEEQPIQFMYHPVWDAEHEAVATYLCRPMRQRPGRMDVHGYDVLSGVTDPEAILELDRQTLMHAVDVLSSLFRQGQLLGLVIPVHFETLAVQARRRSYAALCQGISEHLRRLITFEIAGFPDGIPYVRLCDLIAAVKPFGRATIARVRLQAADYSSFAAAGYKILMAVLPPYMLESRLMSELDRFAAAAEKARIRCGVEGVATSSLALAAQSAGVAYIAGPHIGAAEPSPHAAARHTWMNVYMPKAEGRDA